MKDWKGNEIKVGDTVCVYQFEDMFAGSKCTFGFIGENGFEQIGEPFELKKHQYWVLVRCLKIVEPVNDGSIIGFHAAGTLENPVECPADSLGWNISNQSNFAICIKGVSDNELEHFLHTKKISS